MVEKFGEDYWRDYTLDASKEKDLPYLDTEITPASALKYVGKAYRSFYFRPKRMVRFLGQYQSMAQMLKAMKTGLDLLFKTGR